jgi:hypothetical protein
MSQPFLFLENRTYPKFFDSLLTLPSPHHGGAAVGYYQAHGHIAAAPPYSILIITSMTMYHALGLGKF